MSMNGRDLKTRTLTVNEARPRTDKPETGGGSGRPGGCESGEKPFIWHLRF
jgi:hypothetical protein